MELSTSSDSHGFFTSKSARKMQKLKEKVRIAPKLEDKEYQKLQKSLRKNCELRKRPVCKLQQYRDALQKTASVHGSLCRALRAVLMIDGISGQEEQLSRLNQIQNDIRMTYNKFLRTLDELGAWIRFKQMRQTEKDLDKVKEADKYCQERRLDCVVVNRIARSHSSSSFRSVTGYSRHSYSNHGYLDSTLVNKTFPSGNTPERIRSVENLAAVLYNDAKERAIDAISEAMATNAASQLEVLTALQPLECGCEIKLLVGKVA